MAKPSIAVLPLDNLGGDDATGRLGDASRRTSLPTSARFRDLDVSARNSTAVYKGKSNDNQQLGRDLDVRYVLGGSVQRQGKCIRATAQLIDATTGGHVWADRWVRPIDDVFLLQEELAEQVANRLGGYAVVAQAGHSAREYTGSRGCDRQPAHGAGASPAGDHQRCAPAGAGCHPGAGARQHPALSHDGAASCTKRRSSCWRGRRQRRGPTWRWRAA